MNVTDPTGIKKVAWKRMVKSANEKASKEYYRNEAATKRKLEELNKYKTEIVREKYLSSLSWKDARTIFNARTRMTKMAANYKGSNEDTKCPRCQDKMDNEKHLIDECPRTNKEKIGVRYSHVLDGDTEPKDLRKIAEYIRLNTEDQ